MSAGRNTTIRDQHRRHIARGKPPCGICLEPIDYALPYTDPLSFVVDHVIPVAKGGLDELDNKQAAHRICNRLKSDKSETDLRPGPRTFVTWRTW